MANSDIPIIEIIILLILLVITRVMYVIHKVTTGHTKLTDKKRTHPAKTIICMGSGGHTTEMLLLIQGLDFKKYTPRSYIIAKTDTTTYKKIKHFESTLNEGSYTIYKVPRSREVHQSYITSIFSTLYSILYCIPLILKIRPEVVLCNGPGTCIPICGLVFLLKVAFLSQCRIVFVESFCRTETFSLTGKILMYFADNIVVQWPKLQQKLKRSDYIGQLM
ncbi:UDP-N-acetylglucosamine transferase subunit ALG14 [Onthophagus taurus]|uniref:UDP-N-acetylglucosamine transferase subunit ALG14 n=1 Tax=Onthophagus taurus TaxID=166361 RepID=UPI0039BDCA6D